MYMKDFEDIDIKTYRFFCKCMSPLHVLEIVVEDDFIEIQYHNAGRCGFTLWTRLKKAIRFIFNLNSENWSEFILRDEDRQEFINILKEDNV